MGNVKKSVAERTRHQRQYDRRVNKRHMQTQESKIDTGKAVDVDLISDPFMDEEPIGEVLKNNANDFSSNDMVHNHYLNVAKKKVQERDRNSTTSAPTSARIQTTTDDSKPNPRSNNQTSRSLPVSRVVAYDNVTLILGGKPQRCRIFKSVGLRWIPTGKLFDSCTSKVDSEPPHGSNVDIPHIHECKQTLDVSAGTSINVQKEQSLDLSAGTLCNVNKENLRVWLLKRMISQKPLSKWIHR
ncbi:hypothetical protein Tco_0206315 [Tanacetum coccineum]